MALRIADHMVKLTDKLGIPYVFKGSFKKANRLNSPTNLAFPMFLREVLRKLTEVVLIVLQGLETKKHFKFSKK